MKKIILNVEGMHCPSCEMLIGDSLEEMDGIGKVYVSHKEGTAKIEFDDTKIDDNEIKSIIRKEGYKVD